MSEYFELSFLVHKNQYVKNNIVQCLYVNFAIVEGENSFVDHAYRLFSHKNILFNVYESNDTDFYQFYISIPGYVFHEELFKQELQPITEFVHDFLSVCTDINAIFCSYEMNSYYVSQLQNIQECTPEFLLKFPIIYIRDVHNNNIKLTINLKAQYIFNNISNIIQFD